VAGDHEGSRGDNNGKKAQKCTSTNWTCPIHTSISMIFLKNIKNMSTFYKYTCYEEFAYDLKHHVSVTGA
jgi:hypothetical protein